MGLLPELFNKRIAVNGIFADGIEVSPSEKDTSKNPGGDTPLEEEPPTAAQESPRAGDGGRATPRDR